jgi:hypothetical protein
MSFSQKLKSEVQALVLVTLYFATWFGVLILLKELILAEYQVEFHRLSMALVGALVVAKVVLVLEHVSLGAWVRKQSALINVILRTLLYASCVVVVLLVEKAFDARDEHGSLVTSLVKVLEHEDIHHVWANTICVGGALLVFNLYSVLRQHLGKSELIQLYLSPMPVKSIEK